MLPEVLAENPTAVGIEQRFPEAIVDAKMAVDGLVLQSLPAQIVAVCQLL